MIGLSSNIKNSPQAATYKNSTTPFPQTPTPSLGACTNVNCHFEKETPVWGSAGLTLETGCGTCHDTPPADGNHPTASGPGKKHGDYYGAGSGSCGICHVSHFADANPFSHATSVGRNLILSFNGAPNSGGDYGKPQNLSYPNYLPSRTRAEDRNGSCSNLYCHSDGRRELPKLHRHGGPHSPHPAIPATTAPAIPRTSAAGMESIPGVPAMPIAVSVVIRRRQAAAIPLPTKPAM
ncbi:CxxxxCH/CxxCH domain c-type cytochrome [Geotalea toluenoxydans]|uniref:CxxxxCH/CxxCH domain c-type cytochrome n=1 Tax=Geotalea toluenoxydans TaxID=421624 RepID=UPI000AB90D2A|nr:CxxxxCH/CxxCH domain-containing protein [Geotalea toluenoxydans]